MLVNLNTVALKNGVTLNKVFKVLALNETLLEEVVFLNHDVKNPMIEEDIIKGYDFYCEVIPKESKLRVKVIMGLMKEKMEHEKIKAKILKEVYKAIGFIRKKFEVEANMTEEEVENIVEELFEEGIVEADDIKLAVYKALCEETGSEDVINYYNMILEEQQQARRIKEEILNSLRKTPKIDPETGEIIE